VSGKSNGLYLLFFFPFEVFESFNYVALKRDIIRSLFRNGREDFIMDINKLIEEYNIPVVQIDENRNYWLVRTQSGEFYDDFYFDNFIAVGWDEFNDYDRFLKADKSVLVKENEINYPENKPGLIYNCFLQAKNAELCKTKYRVLQLDMEPLRT
jgi:hypothetical protein